MTLTTLAQRAGLLVSGLLIGCLLGEVAVRAFTRFGETALPIFRPSSTMPWDLAPSVDVMNSGYWGEYRVPIRTNSLGYRDREFRVEPEPGVCRILALGDSFTFGVGVTGEETYPKQLEAALASRAPRARVEVINAGFASGHAPDTALVYFRTHGLRLRPGIVTIGVFEGNDIDDELYTAWPATDEHGWPTRVTSSVYYIDTVGRLRTAAWLGTGGALLSNQPALAAIKLALRDHSEFANFLIQRYRLLTLPAYQTTQVDMPAATAGQRRDAVAKLLRSLDGLRAMTTREGATLVVLSIPSRGERQGTAALHAWAEQTGTTLVDLARLGASQPDLYFPRDGHWTAAGHRRAAALIADAIAPTSFVRRCLTA